MAEVLVVDDSAVARMFARQALESAGYEVREATSVAQAWEILSGAPTIDLILLDWNMPGGNGLELAQLLHGLPALSSIPVVFVTSDADALHREYAAESGARGYVLKPFSPQELLAAVSKALPSAGGH